MVVERLVRIRQTSTRLSAQLTTISATFSPPAAAASRTLLFRVAHHRGAARPVFLVLSAIRSRSITLLMKWVTSGERITHSTARHQTAAEEIAVQEARTNRAAVSRSWLMPGYAAARI